MGLPDTDCLRAISRTPLNIVSNFSGVGKQLIEVGTRKPYNKTLNENY